MEVVHEGFKIVKLCPQVPVDANAVTIGIGKARLQDAKETAAARDRQDHAAQFAEKPLPRFDGNTACMTKFSKDVA